MSGYDLHTHSTCSDGTNSITENVKLALDPMRSEERRVGKSGLLLV